MTTITQNDNTKTKNWPKPLSEPCFRGLAGRIVRKIEPHTESDSAALLFQFLTLFGNAIGRSSYFPIEADRHYLNLFTVLVGPSSKGRKGTSFRHIYNLFKSVDPDWYNGKLNSGLSSGEGLIWHVRDRVESNGQIADEGVSDKRFCAYESEFASVLRVLGRDGNTLSAVIRDAWDRGTLSTITKNNPAKATGAHVSIVAHITKAELNKYLSHTEALNGFGNRFIWVCSRRSKLLPLGSNSEILDLSQEIKDLEECVSFSKAQSKLSLDSSAIPGWKEIYGELSIEKPGLLGTITARAEPQILRIASLYALLDLSSVVKMDHLFSAYMAWKYSEDSCVHIFGNSTGNAIADRIMDALEMTPSGLTQTQIIEDLFGKHKSAFDIKTAQDLLVNQRLVHSRTEVLGSGRPVKVWYFGPAVKANSEFGEVNSQNSHLATDQSAPRESWQWNNGFSSFEGDSNGQ